MSTGPVRPRWNIIVDVTAVVIFIFLTATGLVLRYRLPPGSGRLEGGMGAHSLERPVTVLWGMARHQWGDVHFWLSVVFLGVLAMHLILHWRWFIGLVRKQPSGFSGERALLGLAGLAGVLILSASPFMAQKETVARGELIEEDDTSVRGSMTVREAADALGLSVQELARELGLPADVPPDAHLGRLRRQYGFKLDDVRRLAKGRKSS